MKRWVSLALILAALPLGPARGISTSAASAILMDAETGLVLYEHNADDRRGVASTTKIMTGLLAAELCDLDEVIEAPPGAVGVEGSSIYLRHGQEISVRELLYGLMLKSGNDAAAALAIHIAGSIEGFAVLMNQRAAEIGMTASNFTNPHGLAEEHHFSTARDMAWLTQEALGNPEFAAAVSAKYQNVAGVAIKNHNRLLWTCQGVDGVKTGFTKKTGRCLVSSAVRDGTRLIAVTLNAGNDWNDHAGLYDYGFAKYETRQLYSAGEALAERPVYNGLDAGRVTVHPPEDISVKIPKGQADDVQTRIILPWYFWAPVQKGDELGRVQVTLDGVVLYEGPLAAGETVEAGAEKLPFWRRIIN